MSYNDGSSDKGVTDLLVSLRKAVGVRHVCGIGPGMCVQECALDRISMSQHGETISGDRCKFLLAVRTCRLAHEIWDGSSSMILCNSWMIWQMLSS
jgi:hypothetical protein